MVSVSPDIDGAEGGFMNGLLTSMSGGDDSDKKDDDAPAFSLSNDDAVTTADKDDDPSRGPSIGISNL